LQVSLPFFGFTLMSRPRQSSVLMVDLARRPDENERKIVGGHLDHLA
jgi:hypothetical protein